MKPYFWLFCVLYAFVYSNFAVPSNVCENKILLEKHSPSKTTMAVLFVRSCKEKAWPTVNVTILLSSDKSWLKEGNVYISEGYPEHYSIEWASENVLSITSDAWNEWLKSDVYSLIDPKTNLIYTVQIKYE
ncbi:hypothetical protein A3194_05745 [Candidatus Thiodiazotropha endoloripes]|uniref:hypothetical protein n=1 Tax=Candidatus Thiodiazotropha endoloripes TaxID=1818881 RepID=UPI00083CC312|nr:hypothetical protein [Candidatus Thiodiazotropha endoloripes]ODB94153.1 hypothetical protein A3194_05745 [Candidatus Thiodiazotropha endoloripes]